MKHWLDTDYMSIYHVQALSCVLHWLVNTFFALCPSSLPLHEKTIVGLDSQWPRGGKEITAVVFKKQLMKLFLIKLIYGPGGGAFLEVGLHVCVTKD